MTDDHWQTLNHISKESQFAFLMKHLKSFLNNPYKSQVAAWSSRPLTNYSADFLLLILDFLFFSIRGQGNFQNIIYFS